MLLPDHVRVCVCAGSGGVGKTTTAAALGLEAARRGRRVAVITIDPARRLAQSLGVPDLGNETLRVEPELLEAAGIELRGELWAMMLDPKRTFDGVVETYAPDERTRDAVLSNRIYRQLSSAVAGSQEYMAMERLYELHESGEFELVVLDTPPARNALDFLDAPERLLRFIDSRSLRMFLSPGRAGLRVFGAGAGVALSALERVTGVELLRDLSDFFTSFGGMVGGFRERAGRVSELLRDDSTRFVLVTTPRPGAVAEAVDLRDRLAERGIVFGGTVVNRVHSEGLAEGAIEATQEALEGALGADLADRVLEAALAEAAIARDDAIGLSELVRELGGAPIVALPYVDTAMDDLEGLARMAASLDG